MLQDLSRNNFSNYSFFVEAAAATTTTTAAAAAAASPYKEKRKAWDWGLRGQKNVGTTTDLIAKKN